MKKSRKFRVFFKYFFSYLGYSKNFLLTNFFDLGPSFLLFPLFWDILYKSVRGMNLVEKVQPLSFSVKQTMTTIRSSYRGSWSQHDLSTLGGLSHAALSSCILLLSDGVVCTLLVDDPVNLGDHPLDPSVLSDQVSPRRERARLLHWSLQCPPASSSALQFPPVSFSFL